MAESHKSDEMKLAQAAFAIKLKQKREQSISSGLSHNSGNKIVPLSSNNSIKNLS